MFFRSLALSIALHALLIGTFWNLFNRFDPGLVSQSGQRGGGAQVLIEGVSLMGQRKEPGLKHVRPQPDTDGANGAGDSGPRLEGVGSDEVVLMGDAAPLYPRLSRRLGEQGEVSLKISIGLDGRVAVASLARTSGHERLDESALTFFRTAQFRLKNTRTEALEKIITIAFKLDR